MRSALLLPLACVAAVTATSALAQGPATERERETGEKRVTLARATWETGWFQAEVYRLLLERLGYRVDGPTTMENRKFYEAVAAGSVDLWANGWFPLHDVFWDDEAAMERVGLQIKGGALQGYFVDVETARKHGIGSIADLADPDVATIFDRTGDGRADLVGCESGWACKSLIDRHLADHGLEGTVEQITGPYSPRARDVVERHRAGEAVLFYAFTPHWLLAELEPGEEVVWLEASDPAQPHGPETAVPGLAGCASDPCETGWAINDIQAVANSDFLNANPAVRTLLEQVKIPLEDVVTQNARMAAGEGSAADIRRHAEEWLSANEKTVTKWLAAADPDAVPVADAGLGGAEESGGVLRVAVRVLPPFVTYENGEFGGFEIELANLLAGNLGREIDIYAVDAISRQIDDVSRGAADIAVGAVSVTRVREAIIDFSLPTLNTGLAILVPTATGDGLRSRIVSFGRAIAGSDLPWLLAVFAVFVIISSHIIWRLERGRNPDFAKTYGRGLWDAFYWSVVTMSTVGYGDKVPKGNIGRAFTLVWIAVGTLVFAAFTASIASSLAVEQLRGDITGPTDLPGHRVATVSESAGDEFLTPMGVGPVRVADVTKAYALLNQGRVDAVVFDAPVLQFHASRKGEGTVQTVGPTFERVRYAIAVSRKDPELRKQINLALLNLVELGIYRQLEEKWFGSLH